MSQKKVRVSTIAHHNDFGSIITREERLYWKEKRGEIIKALKDENITVSNEEGTHRSNIIGSNSAHKGMKEHDGYIWIGQPDPSEHRHLASQVVSIQTLHNDAHSEPGFGFNTTDSKIVKPNIIYLPEDAPNRDRNIHKLQYDNYQILFKEGTINEQITDEGNRSRSLDYVVKIVNNPEDLVKALSANIIAKKGIHNNNSPVEVDPKFLQMGKLQLQNRPSPKYRVIVYTSASKNQDELSMQEAHDLGRYISDRNWGLVSGFGNTGLMFQVHDGCVNHKNGWSEGSNCPHIVMYEDVPNKGSLYYGADNTSDRMMIMYIRGEAAVIGGGGRGGGGTYEEFATGVDILTMKNRNPKFWNIELHEKIAPKSNMARKDIELIFDNRKELWGPAIQISEMYGLKLDKNFFVANGTREVTKALDQCHKQTKKIGNYHRYGAVQRYDRQLDSGFSRI